MLKAVLPIALVGCVASEVSEVSPPLDVPQALVDTDFTGGAACLNGPLVTPVFCTVSDALSYLAQCEPTFADLPCWNAIEHAECSSGFEIAITSELPVATSAAYQAFCWSR